MLLDRVRVLPLARLDGEQLALIVPFIQRGVLVEAFVALQADELGPMHGSQRLGDLGLADAGLALEQQRPLEVFHQPERRRDVAVGDVADGGEAVGDVFAVEGHWLSDNTSSPSPAGGGSPAVAKRRRAGWGEQ